MAATSLSPGQVLPYESHRGNPSVCNYLGICRAQIYNLQKEGDFPPIVRISANRVGVRVSDLDAWVASKVQQ